MNSVDGVDNTQTDGAAQAGDAANEQQDEAQKAYGQLFEQIMTQLMNIAKQEADGQ